MNDLVDQFEALLGEYERVKQWRLSRTTYEEGKDADVTLYIVARDLCDFLLEHGPTVTFAATSVPDATFDSDYEWDDERKNWHKKAGR